MARGLVTWSDRGVTGGTGRLGAAHDEGPVLRLLRQPEAGPYEKVWVLASREGRAGAERLVSDLARFAPDAELRVLNVSDPSDYARLFKALAPVVEELTGAAASGWELDVLLSAGTPQAQTLWVIFVQAGLLPARMLQVIPAAFVPDPHPRAVREVRLAMEGFPEIRALRAEVSRLRSEVRLAESELKGESEPMRALRTRLARVAASDVPVLVTGETGTGKELVARALHAASPRASGPFIAENCGSFSEGVLASELFGHEAGAFTGAAARRRGLFELAHTGTLFLDEVGELEPRVQSHLLRVLQEGTLRRVGGEKPVRVDVRVVAATHRDLAGMVRDGHFRQDLYYRLRGATLNVPPLRERVGDLPLLIAAFLRERRKRLDVTPEALRVLQRYGWPGNVRELRSEVLRWTVFCDARVRPADLSPELITPAEDASAERARRGGQGTQPSVLPLATVVERAEQSAISAALEACGGNLAQTARALGIDRNTLKRKLKRSGEGRG
jgi:two-component system, NtrC family, response regulator AtoC